MDRFVGREFFRIEEAKRAVEELCSRERIAYYVDRREPGSVLSFKCPERKKGGGGKEASVVYDNARPKDVMEAMEENLGLMVTYRQALKALELIKNTTEQEEDHSFQKLASYLNVITQRNPGTYSRMETTAGNTFSSLFLYLPTGTNAIKRSDQLVPIAIGICSVEDEENWKWFLQELLAAIPDLASRIDTIIHSRDQGLPQAIRAILPSVQDALCVKHLEQTIQKRRMNFPKSNLLKAAASFNEEGYHAAMSGIL
ncbi:hypothetical protein NDN08_001514 [Rhodosorus marinus]|uniref:MULE transposase domain-containing protein n=1 Tax=Rhodosorus marinus TaxID=101924 RepID=A0AAV8UV96_9RHOD|nr:hypothetical protein NDN08_001514 [Rhodosorus marinus]